MKLNHLQKSVLLRLSQSEWRSAHIVRAGTTTLDALVSRGLVDVRYDQLGAIAMPRAAVLYRLTDAGRAAVS